MAKMVVKKFDRPDERRQFVSRGHADIVKFDGGTVGRAVYEPGWRWSEHVKPIAGTESCQARHSLYMLRGRMRVRMDDGEEHEVGPGDIAIIPPGHDAWVVGNEICEIVDFSGMENYAQPRAPALEEQAPGIH